MTHGEAIAHVRDVLLPALRLDAEKPWNSHLRAHVAALESLLELLEGAK